MYESSAILSDPNPSVTARRYPRLSPFALLCLFVASSFSPCAFAPLRETPPVHLIHALQYRTFGPADIFGSQWTFDRQAEL
jgi:hypothetical protein